MEPRAIRGVSWSLLSFGVNKALTLATTLVLARLLLPAEFGIVTLALLFVSIFTLLGEFGLGSAMVVRSELSARRTGTVLTLMLGTSAVLGALLALGAPLAAELFDEPRLVDPLRVLSAVVVLYGMNWFYDVTLQRALEFRLRFLAQAAQTVAYASVAIVAAALDAGVWALVAGQVAGSITWGLALLALVPRRVRPAWDRTMAVEMLGEGKAFLAQGGLAFVKQNADYAAVGRVLGSGPLGLYGLAYRLAELPHAAIADPVAKVTFPTFARMRDRGEDVGPSFLVVLRLVALVAAPVGILLSAAAVPFTEAVLGDKWLGMTATLTALGLWGAIRPVHSTVGWLLNAAGRPDVLARVSAVTLCALVPGLFVAASLGGIEAAGWAMVAEMTVAAVALVVLAARFVGVGVLDQLRAVGPAAAGCAVCWAATRATAEVLGDRPAVVTLAAALAAGVLAYLAVLQLVAPGLPRTALGDLRRLLGRADATTG